MQTLVDSIKKKLKKKIPYQEQKLKANYEQRAYFFLRYG